MIKYNKRIIARDEDFDFGNRSRLGNAKDDIDTSIRYARKALNDLIRTEDDNRATARKIREAINTLYEAKDMVSDDEGYQSRYGDSCDECRIVKRADSYLVMKGNKVIAEYEDLDRAKRNLRMLKEGRTHDEKRKC